MIISRTINGVPVKTGPGVFRMASNAATAVVKWSTSGFKVVSEEVLTRRLEICRACQMWDEFGNMGLGKCMHHKCGCTRAKMRLATESCPENPPRWTTEQS